MPQSSKSRTPLMQQYQAAKRKHPDALILFRVGDFYETFEEDAIAASRVLDIALTRRSNGSSSSVPLAGIPHHALDKYLPLLIRAGYRVAICDQLEDPKQAKGLVKRGVTELITPGLVLHEGVLNAKKNHFLASLYRVKDGVGLSFLDISTGEFNLFQGTWHEASELLSQFAPAEVLISRDQYEDLSKNIAIETKSHALDTWIYDLSYARDKLISHFSVKSLDGFGISSAEAGMIAAGSILQYLEDSFHTDVGHITKISRLQTSNHVWLDTHTLRHLEILSSFVSGGTSLLDTLDETNTPMGGRLLRRWVGMPLRKKEVIEARLDRVNVLFEHIEKVEDLPTHLRSIHDIARISSKITTRRMLPRDFHRLKDSLLQIPNVARIVRSLSSVVWKEWEQKLDPCTDLVSRITESLVPSPAVAVGHGHVFQDNADPQLAELRHLSKNHKEILDKIRLRETQRTGIPSLKLSHNKVFGYYFEVRHAYKDRIPTEWIRKQTLVNAERYTTPELGDYEEKILKVEEDMVDLEKSLYESLLSFAMDYVPAIQINADLIAQLDIAVGWAFLAKERNYVRPVLYEDDRLDIRGGRHPVIENSLKEGDSYVPNDVSLKGDKEQIWIITGPNMSGKSALLRQTGLLVLMAQMGSFIPCEGADIGIVDRLFTRVGAHDDLSRGDSTFMVEMLETANILNNIAGNSLVLLDEIGRGTSTYDGISIAWSLVEYLHAHRSAPKTLFATHYHELSKLSEDLSRVHNYHITVREVGDKILFLHTLSRGNVEHSFGIHVARMAGIPNSVVKRAREILSFLEEKRTTHQTKFAKPPSSQESLFR
ncbi:MAG: DNA mismatch repair protein MutS [Cytophagales bacterium]|nr:DNA mismatch repair protein MutS [Cytophagales bacterium]